MSEHFEEGIDGGERSLRRDKGSFAELQRLQAAVTRETNEDEVEVNTSIFNIHNSYFNAFVSFNCSIFPISNQVLLKKEIILIENRSKVLSY